MDLPCWNALYSFRFGRKKVKQSRICEVNLSAMSSAKLVDVSSHHHHSKKWIENKTIVASFFGEQIDFYNNQTMKQYI